MTAVNKTGTSRVASAHSEEQIRSTGAVHSRGSEHPE